MEPTEKPTKKGYGKRPFWHWVIIYIIAAIIIYGAIYLFSYHHPASNTTPGSYSY